MSGFSVAELGFGEIPKDFAPGSAARIFKDTEARVDCAQVYQISGQTSPNTGKNSSPAQAIRLPQWGRGDRSVPSTSARATSNLTEQAPRHTNNNKSSAMLAGHYPCSVG
jgi:hypothetical protein